MLVDRGKASGRLLEQPDVTLERGFGRPAYKVGGRMFAVPRADGTLLKLPAARCKELVGSGQATEFRSGGRPAREWVVVAHADDALLLEALAHVRYGIPGSGPGSLPELERRKRSR